MIAVYLSVNTVQKKDGSEKETNGEGRTKSGTVIPLVHSIKYC